MAKGQGANEESLRFVEELLATDIFELQKAPIYPIYYITVEKGTAMAPDQLRSVLPL